MWSISIFPRIRHYTRREILRMTSQRCIKTAEMNEVYLLYTRYYSSVKQVPTALKLLPVELSEFADIETELDYENEMNYHPSPRKVFDVLVPQYIIGLLYGALIQAFASENSARMMAMDSSRKMRAKCSASSVLS